MAVDPIARFRRWYREAERAGIPLPNAVALATATRDGRPSVRYVLLKQADARGFVFYTDARSRKGRELRANPRAALAVHWEPLGHQVRVEGRVVPVSSEEADAYWASRPRGSRLAAAASRQSAPIHSHAALLARWRTLARRHAGGAIPRPPGWTGFRLLPRTLEFWSVRADRLHRRERFRRSGRTWTRRILQP